jgi:hypothetical protein
MVTGRCFAPSINCLINKLLGIHIRSNWELLKHSQFRCRHCVHIIQVKHLHWAANAWQVNNFSLIQINPLLVFIDCIPAMYILFTYQREVILYYRLGFGVILHRLIVFIRPIWILYKLFYNKDLFKYLNRLGLNYLYRLFVGL